MDLHGCDVYLWSETIPKLPEAIGKFKLTFISSRGTRVWPPPAPDVEIADWAQCRFLSEAVVNDQEIDQLVNGLTASGWRWTKCQKLYRQKGVNQFSEPY